jgi:hypothetical protein
MTTMDHDMAEARNLEVAVQELEDHMSKELSEQEQAQAANGQTSAATEKLMSEENKHDERNSEPVVNQDQSSSSLDQTTDSLAQHDKIDSFSTGSDAASSRLLPQEYLLSHPEQSTENLHLNQPTTGATPNGGGEEEENGTSAFNDETKENATPTHIDTPQQPISSAEHEGATIATDVLLAASSTEVPGISDNSIHNGSLPTNGFPAVTAGLPPRPPPQEKPAIHPNYAPDEDIRSYHYPHIQSSNNHTNTPSQNNAFRAPPPFTNAPATGMMPGNNGLPPPPLASFQQPSGVSLQDLRSPNAANFNPNDVQGRGNVQLDSHMSDANEWNPETQRLFDQYLADEKVYTSEGTWDKFPQGSRLFVGGFHSCVLVWPSANNNPREPFQ